jgi:hypothetical protein
MKALIAALLLAIASAAYAACTTHTIFTSDGRMVMCTTCCYGGNCTTNCF